MNVGGRFSSEFDPTQGAETPGEKSPPRLRLCFVGDPRSIHTVRWVRFFAGRGHEVALVSAHPPRNELKVDIYQPLSAAGHVHGTRILTNILELRRFLRKSKPDILHAHYINEAGWLCALSGFRPFVLTAWGSDVYVAPRASVLARVLSPFAVRRADCVTADSLDQVTELRRMGAPHDAARVVGWGVDLEMFAGRSGGSWRAKHGIAEDRTVILSPRRWIANSNVPVVIDAFARVHRERDDVLLILKDAEDSVGARRGGIESRIRNSGIEAATLVIGEIPEEDLPGLYSAADITVSVCSTDGTPVSVLEAMASRSVVVAGDLPSLREWVRDGDTGLLVPIGDVEALAAQLLRLVGSVGLRRKLSQAARRVVEERADRAKNLTKMEHIYRQLINLAPVRK